MKVRFKNNLWKEWVETLFSWSAIFYAKTNLTCYAVLRMFLIFKCGFKAFRNTHTRHISGWLYVLYLFQDGRPILARGWVCSVQLFEMARKWNSDKTLHSFNNSARPSRQSQNFNISSNFIFGPKHFVRKMSLWKMGADCTNGIIINLS